MASAELTASLSYLTDAAHLLRTTAPETSAHLMSQQASLLYHNDIVPSDVQRQHVCGACGHIMIPGQGATLKLETQKALRRKNIAKKKIVTPSTGPSKVISCGFCDRVTKITLPVAERATRRKVTKAPTFSQNKPRAAEPQAPTTANASSKKRAKGRKAGLQALLSGQRQSNSLSLADFMQK
ncbi:hypothetical protein PT974_00272 [Cladobotryum mycophilum]|uniref:Uncharacterized protein n=1 Tax=Cladobotryum mycophilum TaxID=491253 RepID=A0ABR0T1Q9_9HYPO